MRYAIISDVHGNLTALDAVLDDCGKQHIDRYLFLGDYYGDFPMLNEVVAKLMSINNLYVIKGNKEERMLDFNKSENQDWTSEQLAPMIWNIQNIEDENYKFIKCLPEKISFVTENVNFYMAHSPSQHFGYSVVDRINGRTFSEQFNKDFGNHAEYLSYARDAIQSDADFIGMLSKTPDGIYMFGHYHTQWYSSINGKLLINPGSCGLPLDFDTAAPYTILDTDTNTKIDSNDSFTVIERRVKYDMKKAVQELKESDYYNAAPFWSELSLAEFENAKVTVLLFLDFVEKLANERNDDARPYSNELWREAISLYKKKWDKENKK